MLNKDIYFLTSPVISDRFLKVEIKVLEISKGRA